MPRLVTLLTDFGTADGYVGEMKGVLASLAPQRRRSSTSRTTWRRTTWRARGSRSRATGGASRKARCTSSSSIPASAARAARWRWRASGRYARRAGQRRALAGAAARGRAMRRARASRPAPRRRSTAATCSRPPRRSSRSARRSRRSAPSRRIRSIRRTPEATRRDDGAVQGEVITVDRFGNAVTNLLALRGGTGARSSGLTLAAAAHVRRRGGAASRWRWWARAAWWRSRCATGARRSVLGLKRGSSVALLPVR